jgi:branched-subunit amino acid transport protein
MRVASFYRDPAWRLELQRGLRTATLVTRAALLLVGQRSRALAPCRGGTALRACCALAVLIVPEVLIQEGAVNLSLGNPRLVAALAATAFVLSKRSMVGCILAGMLVITAFRFA